MPAHPKVFICSTCFNRVGIDYIKTVYMKYDECGTLKKKASSKESYLICTSFDALIFFIKRILYLKLYAGSCVSISVGYSPHSKKRCLYPYLFTVSALHCLAWFLQESFYFYFLSVWTASLGFLFYVMYCTVFALNLQKIFCPRFQSTCMEYAGQFPPSL